MGLAVSFKYIILGKEIEISLVTIERYEPQPIANDLCKNNNEWIIISNEIQMKNFEKDGFVIPHIDFNRNYLILSKYKISRIYQKLFVNRCSGVPDGYIVFDKKNSDKDSYYLYLMPPIMLSQGIG